MTALLLACAAGPFVWPVDAFSDPLPPHAVARLGTERLRLARPAVAADVSPDGNLIAASEGDNIRLFDARTRTPAGLVHLDQQVDGLRFSPDGLRLVAFGSAVTLFDVPGRRVEHTLPRWVNGVHQVGFAADGKHLAYAMRQGGVCPVEVYSIPGRRVLRRVVLSDPACVMLALSPRGDRLAAVNELRNGRWAMKWWDVATGKETVAHRELRLAWGALAFSPDGRTLAVAGCGDGSALWSLDKGKRLAPLGAAPAAAAVCFSRDGKRVAVAGRDGVGLYDARTGGRLRLDTTPVGTRLTGVRVVPSGAAVAVGVSGHAVHLMPGDADAVRVGHVWPVTSLAFASDGRTLWSSSLDGVRTWEVEGWRQAGHRDPVPRRDFHNEYGTTFLSPEGRYALTPTASWKVRVDDLAAGKHLGEVEANYLEGSSPAFSADGRRAAVTGFVRHKAAGIVRDKAAGDLDQVSVVELPSLRPVRPLRLAFRRRSYRWPEIALSADGVRLAATDGRTARVFDVASGRTLGTVAQPDHVVRPAFSPDGRWLALACPGGIGVWDATTLEPAFSLPVPEGMIPTELAFSPDSRLVAAARNEPYLPAPPRADVAVYELAGREVRRTFPGLARALAFAPDGRRLAAATGFTATVYDLSGAARLRLPSVPPDAWEALGGPGAGEGMTALTLDPDGAVALIGAKLRPAEGRALSARLVKRLMADLRDPLDRARAELLLAEAGPRLAGTLEAALAAEDHPAARTALRSLIRAARVWPGEGMLRPLRAVEVLERISTAEARRLLEQLAAGNPDARLTIEARSAVTRLRAAGGR